MVMTPSSRRVEKLKGKGRVKLLALDLADGQVGKRKLFSSLLLEVRRMGQKQKD